MVHGACCCHDAQERRVAQETTVIEAEPNALPPASATVLHAIDRPARDPEPGYEQRCDTSGDEKPFHVCNAM